MFIGANRNAAATLGFKSLPVTPSTTHTQFDSKAETKFEKGLYRVKVYSNEHPPWRGCFVAHLAEEFEKHSLEGYICISEVINFVFHFTEGHYRVALHRQA